MRTHRTKKISAKVTSNIVIGLLVVFIALIGIIAITLSKDLVKRESDKLTLLAQENASIAREFMESMLDKQEVIIYTARSLTSSEDTQKVKTMEEVITNTKLAEKNALSLFLIMEPNAFIADTPGGYSIFATEAGTHSGSDMYQYINKELYEKAKTGKKMMVVDPFDKIIDGKSYKVITVLQPILNAAGEVAGMIGSNIDTALLNGAAYNSGGYTTFLTQIICGHQTVITNSRTPESIGKKYIDISESTNAQKILDSAQSSAPLTFLDTNVNGQKYYKSYIPFYIKGSSVVWLSGTSITKAEFDAEIVKQVVFIGIWLVLGLIVLACLAYYRINRELRPIKDLEHAVKELSKGNLQNKLEFQSDDELGSLADSLRESTDTLYTYVADIDRAMSEMANGNFDIEPSQPFIGDFRNIELSIHKFISVMSSALSQIAVAAEQVSSGSGQVSDGAQSLSQNASEQAGSVSVLSKELAEISEHIKVTAGNASVVNQLAGEVGKEINLSNEQMTKMIAAMADISSSSRQIGKIIKTIEDIAFQTNILALNAAVEAARAGVAGKGFAVVADEVRNLATKSSEAAKQTNMLIEGSVKSVENGVTIANETANSLAMVVVGAGEIIQLIAGISDASAEQSESIAQVDKGVAQISSVVQMNSATSEEAAAASEELSGQAVVMKSLVSRFKVKDE